MGRFEGKGSPPPRWRRTVPAAQKQVNGRPQTSPRNTLVDDLANELLALKNLATEMNVFGGCCGTDHKHTTKIAEALRNQKTHFSSYRESKRDVEAGKEKHLSPLPIGEK